VSEALPPEALALLGDYQRQAEERGEQLTAALSVLAALWNHHCGPQHFRREPRADDDAEDLLEEWGLLRVNETAIDPFRDYCELPAKVKALRTFLNEAL
jgi:hypothetical protein